MTRILPLWGAGIASIALLSGIAIRTISGKPASIGLSAAAAQAQDTRPIAPEFPELEWLNTDKPLTLKSLQGKIVLLDFWTYCCINCIHIMPDLKKLEKKYPNELVVIGVHSAKFTNEKEAENIRDAILRYEIEHPVVNDKDLQIWNMYGVNSWPTLGLIDPNGRIVRGWAGEGHLEEIDRAIAQLITENRNTLNRTPLKLALEKDKRPRTTLAFPGKLVTDAKTDRLFITDSNNNRIVIANTDGKITQIIGSGKIGLKDGDFETAQFFRPQGLRYDATADAIYVADTENHAVRKIDLAKKIVTTLAGNGKQAGYPPRGGNGKTVRLSSPWDVLQVGQKLYIAMAGTHQLWTLNLKNGDCIPYAGTAGENIKDGEVRQALLAQPSGLAYDGTRLFFADSEVSAVRYADLKKGEVRTLIGEGLFEYGDVDGTYPKARLQHPLGVVYKDGFVYVADSYNHKIKRIDPNLRKVETFIGTGRNGNTNGAAKQATLNEPAGLAWLGNKLYIADTNNNQIRVYDGATKQVSTLKLTLPEKTVAAP
jgi:thiol-disulfide isomerase/thioredoxin